MRLKRTFLTGRDRSNCSNFLGHPLFLKLYNTEMKNQFTYLLPVGCLDASGRKRPLFCVLCPFPSASIQASNWQKICNLIVCFMFVYLCVVCRFEKEGFLKNCTICLVKLKSVLFNLLCGFDLFFSMLAINSVSDFF